MAPCCQCKGTGRCLSCSCAREGIDCTNCYPDRAGRCANQPAIDRRLGESNSQPLPRRRGVSPRPLTSTRTSSQTNLSVTSGRASSSTASVPSLRLRTSSETEDLPSGPPVRAIAPRRSGARQSARTTCASPESLRQHHLARGSPDHEGEHDEDHEEIPSSRHVLDRCSSGDLNSNSNDRSDESCARAHRGCDEQSALDPDARAFAAAPAPASAPNCVDDRDHDPDGAAQDSRSPRPDSSPPEPPVRDLPAYKPCSALDFVWGNLSGLDFAHSLRCAYDEIVHWNRNMFHVPYGRVGKSFIRELTRLFNAFAQASALEQVALDAVMVACGLLLQKPHLGSKASDHVLVLERRLCSWREGDLDGLIREGRTIQRQQRLEQKKKKRHNGDVDHTSHVFARLVLQGKIKSAIRFVTEANGGGVLSLNDQAGEDGRSVLDVLREKHPSPAPACEEVLIGNGDTPYEVHPVLFDRITGEAIRKVVLRTDGSAGPSGVDAAGWRRMCTSFHRESQDLCSAIAATARRLATEHVDPLCLRSFLACRLIPLDKKPGVRPIGVCEVVRRVIGKALMKVVSKEVLQATGPLQLCAGQSAGSEAAVHALRGLFEKPETEAIILVDASNAFNNLNRQVALRNIQFLCPAIATMLTNCYRSSVSLFVGGDELFSLEGTTQGDPLSMAMFALASIPLINTIKTNSSMQVWFADDANAGGSLCAIKEWWDKLTEHGPKYGYFPKALKTAVLVKDDKATEAARIFGDSGVTITTDGRRCLGGALGGGEFTTHFVDNQVTHWVSEVEKLARIAETQPQPAFAALTHGLIGRWIYSTRVSVMSPVQLQPLENAIRHRLLPALTGQPSPGDAARKLLHFPARLGGLGVVDPTTLPTKQYEASLRICSPLVELIVKQAGDVLEALSEQAEIKEKLVKQKTTSLQAETLLTTAALPTPLQRCALAAQEKGTSSWLTAVPMERHGFALHKGQFRDAIALRYGWPVQHVPERCVCNAPFSADHAMICRKGGYPTLRHNEVRNLVASALKEVCADVSVEPRLQPLSGEVLPPSANKEDEARLDVKAKGFWNNDGQDAFLDVRVFHPFAPAYQRSSLPSLYRQHQQQKRREYGCRVRDVEHGSFTPLVFTTSGGAAPEATVFLKRLASRISEKRNEPYSTVMNLLRCRLSFSLLRSSFLCLRGSRSSQHQLQPTSHLADECLSLVAAEGRIYS